MTPTAFKHSLAKARPPAGLSSALTALWWAGKDNWTKAHEIAMAGEGPNSAWVHAYLHRVEDDLENARYWYRQAGRRPESGTIEAEWSEIAAALLAGQGS